MNFLSLRCFLLSTLCVSGMCFSGMFGVYAQDFDASKDAESVSIFVSKSAKAGRIIRPREGNEVCERMNEIVPTPENPFSVEVDPEKVAKHKMFYERLTEAQAKRAEKLRESEARKRALAERKRLAEAKKAAAEKRRQERYERSWMLFDEREAEDAKRREEQKKLREENEERQQREKDFKEYRKITPEFLVKHPAADFFPGAVPESIPRVNDSFKTDNEIRDWQFTGLYAPPGEIIRVHASSAGIGAGYRIRIGSHEDNLLEGRKKNKWKRFPTIIREFYVNNSTVEIANPFGGMIYILAPEPPARRKISSGSQARIPRYARFEFIGVVEAPNYELGETKLAEWTHRRNAPAPWAQLAGKHFIATVPSEAVRGIRDPKKLVEFWDKTIESLNKLSGREEEREKRECIVFDVDSTGFAGHAGETIVLPLELVKTFVDLDYIARNGSWGLFFYLAKNRVRDDWTLGGNKDAPAALLALHCMEGATERPPASFFDGRALTSFALTHPEDAGTPEIIGSYLLPLEAFGWEPLRKAFDVYNNAKKPLIGSELEKAESFVTVWSRAAKSNFGPYFENFGIEYSPKLKMRLERLRKFAPKNFPPELNVEKPSEDCFLGDAPLGNITIFFSDYTPPEEEQFIDLGEAFDEEAPEESDAETSAPEDKDVPEKSRKIRV